MEDGRAADAVDLLQAAVERSGEHVDTRVYGQFGILARGLLMVGNIPSARAHLLMQADLSRGRDNAPMELLYQIDRAPQAPVLLKFGPDLEVEPEAGLGAAYAQALEAAQRGEWRVALRHMQSLAAEYPERPALRKNVALLASRLGDQEAGRPRLARLRGAARGAVGRPRRGRRDRAALGPPAEDNDVDELKLVYGVGDVNRLMERLLSDPRVIRFEGDLRELVEENETPPKLVCSLLDRPEKAPEGESLTVETVPTVLGEIYLYGRRTDREARLEFEATRDERYERAKQLLAEAAGNALGPLESEEVTEQTSRLATALTWRWRFPPGTPEPLRRELMNQKRRQLIFERWAELPRKAFGGQSARQAAGQDAYRVSVAAAILLLESAGDQMRWEMDLNPLREQVGLPAQGEIDPASVQIAQLPLVRLSRLPIERLGDDDLTAAYDRAAAFNHASAWAGSRGKCFAAIR